MAVDDRFARLLGEIKGLREQARDTGPLRDGGGGGTSGGVTDDWKASVDRQLGQLHADIRAMLNRGVAAVVALAALIGGLYVRGDIQEEQLRARVHSVELRLEKMDAKLDRIDEKLNLLVDRKQAELAQQR